MNTSNDKMKWILFVIFLTLFVLIVLGTLGAVFFDFGNLAEDERSWLVKGLFVEISACVMALFYSIFELKKTEYSNDDRVLRLGERVKGLESLYIEIPKEIEAASLLVSSTNNIVEKLDVFGKAYPVNTAIESFDMLPPFSEKTYSLTPLHIDITHDVEALKPFDRHHRANSYIGLKVQWKCSFLKFREDDDTYSVFVNTEAVFFKAHVLVNKNEDISQLKILNEHHPLWIAGEISKVDNFHVELINGIVAVKLKIE